MYAVSRHHYCRSLNLPEHLNTNYHEKEHGKCRQNCKGINRSGYRSTILYQSNQWNAWNRSSGAWRNLFAYKLSWILSSLRAVWDKNVQDELI